MSCNHDALPYEPCGPILRKTCVCGYTHAKNPDPSAFGRGFDAYRDGKSLFENPFKTKCLRRQWWREGWRAAKKKGLKRA